MPTGVELLGIVTAVEVNALEKPFKRAQSIVDPSINYSFLCSQLCVVFRRKVDFQAIKQFHSGFVNHF